MTQVTTDFINTLKLMTPNDRLKYIRKQILKVNQDEFCLDGSIGISTLKDIERGACKITNKIASKLLNKLLINGIYCNNDFFSEEPGVLSIKINHEIKDKTKLLNEDINYFTNRMTKLAMLKIETNNYAPLIPKDSLIFFDPMAFNNYETCNNILCLIEGAEEKKIFFLTYRDDTIHASFNNKDIILTKEILDICKTYRIESIFYAYK